MNEDAIILTRLSFVEKVNIFQLISLKTVIFSTGTPLGNVNISRLALSIECLSLLSSIT